MAPSENSWRPVATQTAKFPLKARHQYAASIQSYDKGHQHGMTDNVFLLFYCKSETFEQLI